MHFLEILYFILFLLAFRYVPILQLKNEKPILMPIAFALKTVVGFLFLLIYLHPDTNNSVPSDTMRFLSESEQLHAVFQKSPSDYFTLLSGIGEDTELIKKHLSNTFLWDAGSDTIINDSRNVIRLHSLIQFISFGSPFIHSLFMCFFALIGLRHLFLTFQPFIEVKPILLFLALLLFPSLLFWTSGILKEPILFLGLSMFTRSLLLRDSKLKRVLFGCLGIALLLSVKPYVLACLIPSLVFYLIYRYIFKSRFLISIAVFLALGISSLLLFSNGRQKAVDYLSRKQYDFDHIGKGGLFIRGDSSLIYFSPSEYPKLKINIKDSIVEVIKPANCMIVSREHRYKPVPSVMIPDHEKRSLRYNVGGAMSYIKTTPINRSFTQLIKNIPEALINSFLRPFPNDPGSSLKFPAMFEVWLLIILLIYSLFNHKIIDKFNLGILASLFIFSICLFLIIGWTTPVIGAIFRYRFPAQLAILLISLILLKNRHKIKKA